MGWNRFFSGNGHKRITRNDGRRNLGHRPVRFEQMEQRVLLSVNPASPPIETTDLGHVDYRELDATDQTYQLTTRHDGTLTAELEGSGTVEVYDADYNLISSAAGRVDLAVSEAEIYFVTLTGTTAGEDLWLANLVDAGTTDLVVYGTTQNDAYSFSWTLDNAAVDTYTLTVNRVAYAFSAADVASLELDAGPGRDSVDLVAGLSDDHAEMRFRDTTLTGSQYDAIITNAEDVSIHGGGGYDIVEIYDSAGNDTLTAIPTAATLSAASFTSVVSEFSEIHAVGENGGYDVASLYDSAEDDTYIADSDSASLGNTDYYNEVQAFDEVHAYANSGGDDTAQLYDSPGNDTFVSREEISSLSGDGFFNRAKFFDFVTGHSTAGGADVARLYDTTGNDLFWADATSATMTAALGAATYGEWLREADGFAQVYGYASDGTDTAELDDSSGNDTFDATSTTATMSGSGFSNTAVRFDENSGNASNGGIDVASLFDSTGNDTFEAQGGTAAFYLGSVTNRANGFEQAHGYAKSGGIDVASLFDTSSDDLFVAGPEISYMSGGGFYNRAKFFDQVHGYAKSGGIDTAQLHGSSGDDTFFTDADLSLARMTTGATMTRAKFFETAGGFAVTGGTDSATMRGTTGDDILNASPTTVSLTSGGMLAEASRFATTVVTAVDGGTDTAEFTDSTGSDRFEASPGTATMSGTGFRITADAFDTYHAYARNGGSDTAILYGSAGNDTFVGDATFGKIFNDDFFIRAKLFAKVIVRGSGGIDTATMYDSAGNDRYLGNKQVELVNLGGSEIVPLSSPKIPLRPGNDELYASGNLAQIRSSEHTMQAYDFTTVTAYSVNGGVDTTRLSSVTFALNPIGPWINPAVG